MAGGYRSDFIDVVNIDYQGGSLTVGTSQQFASANGSSNLERRQELNIYNKSSNIIYYGPTGVTTSTGIPIQPEEIVSLQYGPDIDVYLIAGSAGNTVIVQELS